MELAELQKFCRRFPGTTEDLKWGNHITFLVGQKMFAILSLEKDRGLHLSLKTTAELSRELTRRKDIVPAPYLARYHWICLTDPDGLECSLLEQLIADSYQLIFSKLTKKLRVSIGSE